MKQERAPRYSVLFLIPAITIFCLSTFIAASHAAAGGNPCDRADRIYGVAITSISPSSKRNYAAQISRPCPEHTGKHILLGDALADEGRYDQALEQFKIVLSGAAPGPMRYLYDAYVKQGDLYYKIKEYEKALQSYSKAAEINGDEKEILNRIIQAKSLAEEGIISQTALTRSLTKSKTGVAGPKQLPSVSLKVNFDFDSDVIRDTAIPQIDALGRALSSTELKGYTFELAGHTDTTGPYEYNQGLSLRRARSVRRYLIERFHIDPSRLKVVGYGEQFPLYPEVDEFSRDQNRRVEVLRLESEGSLLEQAGTGLKIKIGFFYSREGLIPGEIRDGITLYSGDRLRFEFTPLQNCYVYLATIDSSGNFLQLFPNTTLSKGGNPVVRGRRYMVPGNLDWVELDEIQGTEEIYLLVTRNFQPNIENLLVQLTVDDDAARRRGNIKRVFRAIGIRPVSHKVENEPNVNILETDETTFIKKIAFYHLNPAR